VRRVALYDDPAQATAAGMISALRSAITPRTKVLALTRVHSGTGVHVPVERLGDVEPLVVVDGVHAPAAVEDPLAASGPPCTSTRPAWTPPWPPSACSDTHVRLIRRGLNCCLYRQPADPGRSLSGPAPAERMEGALMRIDFISRLALLLVAGFLVIVSQVWTGGTVQWLFVVGGIVMIALAGVGLARRTAPQRGLDGLLGLLGVWSIVQAVVFDGSTLEWVSFATAIAAALIATVGLTIHEMTTERVVHELSVVGPGDRAEHAARA
jgi:hypothetical protein